MKKILVLGAGLSSSCLIRYLLQHAAREKWFVTVADQLVEQAQKKIGRSPHAKAIAFNIQDKTQREKLIQEHDLVISLMPPTLHLPAAKDCVKFKKHLVTASYVSAEIGKLHKQAQQAGVLLLNEIGLDPGIDHLSAMELIEGVKKQGGHITAFRSYCGGLVAPEFDDNPWNYKFTWNPRNVIVAGQATARFRQNGQTQYIPYNRIFTETEKVTVKGYGSFEAYANRDSNGYIEPYGISDAHTVLRGTLRKNGFCGSWNNLVKLGLTDDALALGNMQNTSYREFISSFLPQGDGTVENRTCRLLQISASGREFKKLQWLGLFSNEPIGLADATPAKVLQHLLMQKWALKKGELDMIVMQHQLEYTLKGKAQKLKTSLVVKGENEIYTAMAKTVGLPMAIAAKLILQNKIKARGVCIPVTAEFYEPILQELEKNGISFFRG